MINPQTDLKRPNYEKIKDLPSSIKDLFLHPIINDPDSLKFKQFLANNYICFFDKAFLESDWQMKLLTDWAQQNKIN